MKVYISPGHGGNDPGAVANGLKEKDVVLDVSKQVRQILEAQGISVRIARETDIGVELESRVIEANAWKADCYVSIHANAADTSEANGFEVFHSITPGAKGKRLAELIVRYLDEMTPLRNRGAKTRASEKYPGHDYYMEIDDTNMPAVIVEIGFVTSPIDAAFLRTGRQNIAQAISYGILEWLGIERVILPDIAGHWAEAEIRKAYNLGLVKGRDDGLFHPNDPLTRAEAATLICRLYEEVKR